MSDGCGGAHTFVQFVFLVLKWFNSNIVATTVVDIGLPTFQGYFLC